MFSLNGLQIILTTVTIVQQVFHFMKNCSLMSGDNICKHYVQTNIVMSKNMYS